MRSTSAGFAGMKCDHFVTMNIAQGRIRFGFDFDEIYLRVEPQHTQPPTNGAVAFHDPFRLRIHFKGYGTAMTASIHRNQILQLDLTNN
ncbi:MAG: hypothetical protein ABJO09_11010 [Hyphomicrobiales bacterium]